MSNELLSGGEKFMDHLFDARPERPGYRLHRLEVFNWGTFDSSDGKSFLFEPEGRTSLLIGHNGSGKSTLVDAILTLLVDGRTRNYNVAAGAKKTERTPKSYIKGAFDRILDESQSNVVKYLRPKGNHLTALSAVFRDEQLDKAFTLTQILYLKSDGSDDKIFAIADEPHELKQDLAGLKKSNAVREHLKKQGYQTTKTYMDYQGWITKRTQMRGKAIDMFNETVAVKDIRNLNTFIRTHMLETHDWRDKVQRLLTHFNDLSIAHQELVRARRSVELLTPVKTIGVKYRLQDEKKENLEQILNASKTFFPVLQIKLFKPEIEKMERTIASILSAIKMLGEELKKSHETIRELKNDIDQAGGERLKQIPHHITMEERNLADKQNTFKTYHAHLKTCGLINIVDNTKLFLQANDQLQKISESFDTKIATLNEQYEKAITQKGTIEKELQGEQNELQFLEKRQTNLPKQFTTMRSRICEELNLDESVLLYAAELISVAADQQEWEASVEMVLRPFALSLLVPDRYYPRVRAYVEHHHLSDSHGNGQRLNYISIGKPRKSDGDRTPSQSIFHKLKLKPSHNLTPWLRGEILYRFNFHCCENVEEFHRLSGLSMTKNRHVKFNNHRHQKDDRPQIINPIHFVLGWNNVEKKRRLAERIQELEANRATLKKSVIAFSEQLEERRTIHRAADAAIAVANFESIDFKRHQNAIVKLQEEKKELEQSNDVVKILHRQLEKEEANAESLNASRDARLEQKAGLENDMKRANKTLETAQKQVQNSKVTGQFDSHQKHFDNIFASIGKPDLSIENFELKQKHWEHTTYQQIDELRKPLQQLGDRLVELMAKFLREFQEEKNDLNASIASLPSFLGILDKLHQEDLPRYEKQFKERLNAHVTQDIGIFNIALNEESKQIVKKIKQLNKALSSVEYRPGTFMKLEPRPVKDGEINEFKRSLLECLDESLEQTDEANETRFLRMQSLVKKLSDKEKTTWRKKVIDVRNWFDFAAQEVERETLKPLSCYDGSSGQSGGEKAKLAFTILVAAIAYQFDIDPVNQTPGRFQFVVIDEMFSKVDDQNARYALELFEKFKLQLLIVAPLDPKAMVAEPFVDRYLHVTKNPTTNRSEFFSITAREYDEVVKQFSGNENSQPMRKSAKK